MVFPRINYYIRIDVNKFDLLPIYIFAFPNDTFYF